MDESDKANFDILLENNREIKLGNKGHHGIKDKEFLAEEVRKDEELDDDIVDCKLKFVDVLGLEL